MNKIKVVLIALFLGVFILAGSINAEDKEPKKSPNATVSQTIGIDTEITFSYSSPGVKGRTIWGDLVPWGFEPGNKYSKEEPFPWRGGANKNTTIEFNKDLLIEGKKVAAGKYSLHFKTGKKEWTVMINSVNDKWGSYEYDPSKDVTSFTVTSVEAPFQEWLTYGFEGYDGYKTTAFLHWEKIKIPFSIVVDK